MVQLRVTYSVGSDTEKITEVVEATNEGTSGARAAIERMYPNKIITIYSCQRV